MSVDGWVGECGWVSGWRSVDGWVSECRWVGGEV